MTEGVKQNGVNYILNTLKQNGIENVTENEINQLLFENGGSLLSVEDVLQNLTDKYSIEADGDAYEALQNVLSEIDADENTYYSYDEMYNNEYEFELYEQKAQDDETAGQEQLQEIQGEVETQNQTQNQNSTQAEEKSGLQDYSHSKKPVEKVTGVPTGTDLTQYANTSYADYIGTRAAAADSSEMPEGFTCTSAEYGKYKDSDGNTYNKINPAFMLGNADKYNITSISSNGEICNEDGDVVGYAYENEDGTTSFYLKTSLFETKDESSTGETGETEGSSSGDSSDSATLPDGLTKTNGEIKDEDGNKYNKVGTYTSKSDLKDALKEKYGLNVTIDGNNIKSDGKIIGKIAKGDDGSLTCYLFDSIEPLEDDDTETKETDDKKDDEESVDEKTLPEGLKEKDGKIVDEDGNEYSKKGTYEDEDEIISSLKDEFGEVKIDDNIVYDEDGNIIGRIAKGDDGLTLYMINDEADAKEAKNKDDEEEGETGSLSNQAIKQKVDMLYNATKGFGHTDEDVLKQIFYDESISPSDFVRIVQAYNEKYGDEKSLIEAVDDDTSGDLKLGLEEAYAEKLLQACRDGSDDAYAVLCQEIYNGTAGMMGTADEFVKYIIDSKNIDVLTQLVQEYEEHTGSDLISDITNDFRFSGKGDLIAVINAAKNNVK